MEIAILVFFIAIFGGVLFLLALVWFIFRRIRNSRSGNRNFSSSSNYGSDYDAAHHRNITNSDDDAAIYAGSSLLANQESEKPIVTETARDSAQQSDNSYSHESHGASAAPAETNYTESSYSSSSYDSGSSSSSDSSSSSSDSGSSSSSSD